MPQSKEAHREYMRNKRQGSQNEVHKVEGSQARVHSPVTLSIANKLVDPKWRALLEYLATNLRHDHADDVRVGCYGPTISELKPLLASVPG